jgi:hypothetical protein
VKTNPTNPTTGNQLQRALTAARGVVPMAHDGEALVPLTMRELMTLRSVLAQNHELTDKEIDWLFLQLVKPKPDSLDKMLRDRRTERMHALKRHRSKVERLMEIVNHTIEGYSDED